MLTSPLTPQQQPIATKSSKPTSVSIQSLAVAAVVVVVVVVGVVVEKRADEIILLHAVLLVVGFERNDDGDDKFNVGRMMAAFIVIQILLLPYISHSFGQSCTQ
jgi:hypothetical protein